MYLLGCHEITESLDLSGLGGLGGAGIGWPMLCSRKGLLSRMNNRWKHVSGWPSCAMRGPKYAGDKQANPGPIYGGNCKPERALNFPFFLVFPLRHPNIERRQTLALGFRVSAPHRPR